jgi:serine/threonine protein kinase/tetratricopeptide (TPR) repeat protein
VKQGDVVADRFEILRLAGEGGMGVVYQALDRTSGDRVALKVLHRGGESYAARFAREAEVLAELEHPGIVRHIAHGATTSTELYLAMEWLEGEDLAQRLARTPLTIEESVTLARRAAAALGAAHDRGIVHRDVKPSNLMLVGGDVEQIKLLDFGIARVEAGTMTITGITFGTPGYMAPEQARGARELDARADIFALGSVLFQCLTGRAAFVGEHLMAVLAKIVLEEAPRVRELRHDVPRALDQLVARMLSKAPDLRPRDGHELAAELAALGPIVGSSPASIFPFAPESSLTPGEQRLLCVVLAGSPRSPPVVIASGGGADRGANSPEWSGGGASSPPRARIAPGDLTMQSSAGAHDAEATPQAEPGAPASTPPARGDEPSGPGADPADRPDATLIAGRSAATVTLQRLREAAALCDARIEQLADGSVIATLAGGQSATDQAAQAARCALAIQAHMPGLPVVLATGRGVMAGRLPVGAAIDRAVELLRTAPRSDPAGGAQGPDSVRIDEVTAGLLDARFDVTGEPGSHCLQREREMPEANRTLLGRPTPCVGRERELLTLDATLVECLDEPVARAVLVTAPAGIGKSRLASEFLRKIADRGPIEVWTGRGDPVSAGSPFGMIAPALRRAAGVLEGEPVAVRRKKLAARVGRHLRAEDASRVIAFIGELVGVPFEDRPATRGPGEASVQLRAAREDVMLMGDQMRRAWEDFLAAECAAQPVLIVLEDLHWGDLPSVKLVDAALRHLRNQPLMVLALARPEVRELFPGLWAERSVLELRLDELSRRASERLARHVLGASVSAGTVSKLVAQADGNAFYLEELIRAVAEGRGDSLPETVLAMVQARLEGLKPEERLVLRAASVFGQVFWRGGVRALLGGDASFPLAACLQELEEREIITRARTAAQGEAAARAGEPPGAGEGGSWQAPREEEHAFRHSLVREAAYGMLTDADRTLGHKLAGEWLERMGEVEAIGLAEHFERGREPERARRWYLRAAEQALGGNDLGAAIVRSERGAQNGATGEELGAIRLLQAEALRWRGEHAEAQSRAIEAMRWLPRGSPRWFSAAGEVALGSARVGAYEPLTDLVDDLCAPDAPVSRQLVVALVRAALSLLFAGRSAIVARIFARIDEVEPQLEGDPAVMAVIHRLRANRAASGGDPSEYLRGLEATIACFERAGDARNACNARANAGHACMELGAYAEAERTLREVLSTAERLGLSTVAAAAKHNLGLTLMRQGAIDAGLSAEIEAVDAFHAQGERRLEGASRMYLAMILAAAGRLEDAEREALCAVDLVASLYGGLRAAALAVLASVRLARGHADGALAAAAEAMEVLERLGGLEEGESLSRLTYAEALHATGDASTARAVIAAARERLLARADRIGDPASRASFLERVPENARILALADAWAGAEAG